MFLMCSLDEPIWWSPRLSTILTSDPFTGKLFVSSHPLNWLQPNRFIKISSFAVVIETWLAVSIYFQFLRKVNWHIFENPLLFFHDNNNDFITAENGDMVRFDANPDPDTTFHFDTDPDPDPTHASWKKRNFLYFFSQQSQSTLFFFCQPRRRLIFQHLGQYNEIFWKKSIV